MLLDILIFIGIAGGIIFLYLMWFTKFRSHKKFKKYSKAKILLSFLIALGVSTLFYGSFLEPRRLIIEEYDINLSAEQNKKIARIAFISDQHLREFKKETYTKKLADKLLTIDADILLIGGDFLSGNEKAGYYYQALKEVAQKFPTYAVWGNHDYNVGVLSDEVRDDTQVLQKVFKEIGITPLMNEHILIETENNDSFWLLGTDSFTARRQNVPQAFEGLSPKDSRPKILLAHNPDVLFDVTEYYIPIDIVLSGHTHGGQIRLPFIGALASLPIYIGQKYDKGLFDYKGYKLFITSGVGEVGTRARLFNPPEISILNIWQ